MKKNVDYEWKDKNTSVKQNKDTKLEHIMTCMQKNEYDIYRASFQPRLD